MNELDEALAQISAIRKQIARAEVFRGYGPAAVLGTAAIAAFAAIVQPLVVAHPVDDVLRYLALWTVAAASCAILVVAETIARTRRMHAGLEQEMVVAAVEQLLPASLAGAALTAVIGAVAPESAWMLPGLWQVVFSLGVFASIRFLPAGVFAVGAWYLVCGIVTLVTARGPDALAPWAMGVPFAFGQSLSAFVLWRSLGGSDEP
ncbi:MAG: hypothetical protein ACREQJ_17745 [Candidatus Binatia bacterium]